MMRCSCFSFFLNRRFRPNRYLSWLLFSVDFARSAAMFAHSVYVTVVAPWNRVTVKHARDVAAPWDEAPGCGQPHLHDRQRHERGGGDLVHPAGDALGSFPRLAGRTADPAIAAL